ncbi:MAG: heme-binding protein, partial [Arenimonas sp.]
MSKFPDCVATAALALLLAACPLASDHAIAAAPGFNGNGECAEDAALRCRLRRMPVGPPVPLFAPLPAINSLAVADVERIVSQAVGEAQARGARATIAVVDRVGNVLVVFRMAGAGTTFRIASGRSVSGGLEGVNGLADSLAAISKAITGAYLSSNGNAFSTRSASQIVQENFNPREFSQPSGPLFGVQFSQLSCSDLMRRDSDAMLGPKRSPLGLSADAGGLPLYKAGTLVGGIGVIADGLYSLDL